jgi:hypothetical protein
LGIQQNIPFTKCQTSQLASKNCKQATPYSRPSPAIVEYLAFVQTSFGPLDLGSSTKKIGNQYCPQQKGQLQFFSQPNSIDAVDDHTCIIYCIVGITM